MKQYPEIWSGTIFVVRQYWFSLRLIKIEHQKHRPSSNWVSFHVPCSMFHLNVLLWNGHHWVWFRLILPQRIEWSQLCWILWLNGLNSIPNWISPPPPNSKGKCVIVFDWDNIWNWIHSANWTLNVLIKNLWYDNKQSLFSSNLTANINNLSTNVQTQSSSIVRVSYCSLRLPLNQYEHVYLQY